MQKKGFRACFKISPEFGYDIIGRHTVIYDCAWKLVSTSNNKWLIDTAKHIHCH